MSAHRQDLRLRIWARMGETSRVEIHRPVTDAELAEMGLVDISKATPVESMGGLTGAMYPVEHIDDADGWFVPKGRT